VQADLDDPASLDRALEGAAGVFSVQDCWGMDVGYAGEICRGRALAEGAEQMAVAP
jgi:uncharacterized protein YbjT (DUF2867 family)